MTNHLAHFAAACHNAIKADPGPAGRRRICALLADLLKDQDFIATHLPEDGPEREVLYEDAELEFCIVAHVNLHAKQGEPHDHGPTWALYGQASGETTMTDWEKLEAATDLQPGKVRPLRSYTLKPGMLRLYNEGNVHSYSPDGPTRLVRIEGMNMDKVKRLKYQAVAMAD